MADLVTITEYKAYASISSTSSDAQLTILIPMVSSFVRTYCNRTFEDNTTATAGITESYSGGGFLFYVKEPPVVGIISMLCKTYSTGDYIEMVSEVDYEYDEDTEAIVSLWEEGFPNIPNAIKVVYNGGFVTVPADLKLGIFYLITYYLKGEMVAKKSLNSKQLAIENVSSLDLPPHIKRIFDLYRLVE